MEPPKLGVTFSTYTDLILIAQQLLVKGITDGGLTHEPDKFREQGIDHQLEHAYQHIDDATIANEYGTEDGDDEDHLAHALTRICFAELLRREANG